MLQSIERILFKLLVLHFLFLLIGQWLVKSDVLQVYMNQTFQYEKQATVAPHILK